MIIDARSEVGQRSQTPKRIIVHAMGEYVGGVYAPKFLNNIGLSAHALVTPNGDIIKCREDFEGAYHAKRFNVDSLGIEFLVPGDHDITSLYAAMDTDWVNENQFLAGARWVAEWVARWDITQIDRHSDVDPKRKRDPGKGFDWPRFLEAVR